jgi:hypothetical protein
MCYACPHTLHVISTRRHRWNIQNVRINEFKSNEVWFVNSSPYYLRIPSRATTYRSLNAIMTLVKQGYVWEMSKIKCTKAGRYSDCTVRGSNCQTQWPLACWDCGFESRRGNGCLCCTVKDLRQNARKARRINKYRWSRKRVQEGKKIAVGGGGGWDFPHPSRPALGLTQRPVKCVPGLFLGGKAEGAWRCHPSHSSPLGLHGLS